MNICYHLPKGFYQIFKHRPRNYSKASCQAARSIGLFSFIATTRDLPGGVGIFKTVLYA
jgi:hypothetical protein